ncbi:hydrogenase expression/formation protein HypE [uncultured Campylobacter sp.]|uniref:hydrogenase expression/formation protein HypE n=1 Tax=uncultured Campylobacter sp. TaxID=218934 RepID=UPI0026039D65|nr:hydrogenase expression/formation protein HypE [uncultured Campylobacter sp.]
MNETILLSHGGGGEEMNRLINETIFAAFDNEILRANNDSAILNLNLDAGAGFDRAAPSSALNSAASFGGELAFSTDSFVVTPLFFNGGDIGKIAVCGTVNDLAMVGAKPLFLSCALIIEEGLSLSELRRILDSMASTARSCGVRIVCGDTKVVPRGKCDKIFINTSGIGRVLRPARVQNIKAGAKILLSGDIGRHGAVILAARDEIALSSELQSDCKPLCAAVEKLISQGVKIQAMRDATRGGLSAVLNEFASSSGLEFLVREEDIKISDEVVGVCELLGFEPYELANEGTFVAIVEDDAEADRALDILREFDANAAIIGEVREVGHDKGEFKGTLMPKLGTRDESMGARSDAGAVSENRAGQFQAPYAAKGRVILQNAYGSQRFLELPKGELLPRIC